jgi:hypothetical protein
MNQDQHSKTQGSKKPYTKPELSVVPLRPEEAVLGSCKTNSGASGPGGSGNCHPVSSCSSLAS